MPTTYKKMKFHRLRMYRVTAISEDSKQVFLTMEQAKEALKACLMVLKASGKVRFKEFIFRKKTVDVEFIDGIAEFLQGNTDIIVGKLSSPKDAHAYQIRTNGTADERNLVLSPQERFEARSYFVLDTKNMIIGYLHEQSAPSVYSLGGFIQSVSKEDVSQSRVFAEVTDIATSDMTERLSQMACIGTITGYSEIPSDLPVDVTGLSERMYKKLTNQKVIRSSFSLVVDRRGVSAFPIDNEENPSEQELADNRKDKYAFFEGISKNKFLKKLTVRAKETENSRMKDIFLDNNPLVYSVPFDYGKLDDDRFDVMICQKLKSEYILNKDEIRNQYRD